MKRFMYRLERIVSKIAVDNLMLILIGAMGIVYVAGMMVPELYALLYFDRALIMSGQVWRVFTFLFIQDGSLLQFLLFAYFYWWIGSSLENYWGKSGFCTYYYIGIIALIIAGFISGYSTATYLNLSLFFAFAMLDPNHEILLFFVLPVKVKWIAWLDAAYFVYIFIFSSFAGRLVILASVLNFFLFFYDDFIRRVKLLIWDIKYKMRNK